MKQGLWAFGTRMTERDAKFAVKTGMATALLSAPAFFDATRPIFLEYYGDWALISVGYSPLPLLGRGPNLHSVLCCHIADYWCGEWPVSLTLLYLNWHWNVVDQSHQF